MNQIEEYIETGENIFLYGPGGTGKSHTIKEIYKKYEKIISVTASTGIAAVNLECGATTIHSWSGIRIGKLSASEIAYDIRRKRGSRYKETYLRWINCKILVIDEISMISNKTFELLENVARLVRENDEIFGGIKLIVSGDFLQLKPIKDDFIFKSKVWEDLKFKIVKFETPYRYDDIEWFNLLCRIRKGDITDKDVELLESRLNVQNLIEVKPTKLFSLKKDVEKYNLSELNKLEEKLFIFEAYDSPNMPDYIKDLISEKVPYKVSLKVGAQVLITSNINVNLGIANGTRGIVKEINYPENIKLMLVDERIITISGFDFDVYYKENGKTKKCTRTQIPVILAWALTGHKCQGTTIDYVLPWLDNTIFSEGQGYVMLSRCRRLNGIFLEISLDRNCFKVNKDALEYDKYVNNFLDNDDNQSKC